MILLRTFLILVFAAILVYTVLVGLEHGWNLIAVFFGDIASMTWPGQFNLDFFTFLLLSGLWLSWRHNFSPGGLALGLAGVFGGMLFLSAYLLIVSIQAKGDMREILMGKSRVAS